MPLYDFDKLAIWLDVLIFSSSYLPTLIGPGQSYERVENWKPVMIGY